MDASVQAALIGVAGTLAGVGGTVTVALYGLRHASSSSRAAIEASTVNLQQTIGSEREGQLTDRYTRAIEQLGSDKLEVRMGGVYALERVARDSPRDHPIVIEVLAAFVRQHAKGSTRAVDFTETPDLAVEGRSPCPDVQAALTVICRRDSTLDGQPIDLCDVWLPAANLSGARLAGAALRGANLRGGLLGDADLANADLTEADLTDAGLAKADLSGALLYDAMLAGAILTEANLTGAQLNRATLTGAYISRANLAGANLSGVYLLAANLTNTSLAGANLAGAILSGAKLGGADLRQTRFSGANLTDAVLAGSDLTGAYMTGAILVGADFTQTLWPSTYPEPEGWSTIAETGRLTRLNLTPRTAPEAPRELD